MSQLPSVGPPRAARFRVLLALFVCGLGACVQPIEHQPFCADTLLSPPLVTRSVTWSQDVGAIILGRCANCHAPDDVGPFPLTSFEETFALRDAVRAAVVSREMPPWLAASCCNTFFHDTSLTPDQIALVDAWVDQGAPKGPDIAVAPLDPAGTLSRVDVTATMPVAYTPKPADGRIDDFRCFVLDWPVAQETMITGLRPKPGARSIVHHLIVATLKPEDAAELRAREGEDGRPGFSCEGALGGAAVDRVVGGSLLGGDFPADLGATVPAGSQLLLNIHYSLLGKGALPDQTSIEFRTDDVATPYKTLAVANPWWLMGEGMRIEAGDADKVYAYQYDPALQVAGKTIQLRSVLPHMHALGSRLKVSLVRADGSVECLAEFVNYDYGWEQPFWFSQPRQLNPGDQLHVQCHFDNSAANQPLVGGVRPAPKDIAWGTDNQEMCVAFLNYTETP